MAARLRKTHQEDVRAIGWKWYVYKFFSGDDCVYVGKGCGNRIKAQQKRFFEFNGYVVASFKNEKDALLYEKAQILELKPQLNKVFMPDTPKPWTVRLLPEHKDMDAWCEAIGTRAMSARLCLRYWWLCDQSKLEMFRKVANFG